MVSELKGDDDRLEIVTVTKVPLADFVIYLGDSNLNVVFE